MKQLNAKMNDVPKLVDCYGDRHDYKLSAQYYNLDFRFHNKKLNITRNIKNEKLQRQKNKENFLRTKDQLKMEYKSNRKANLLETRSKIKSIKIQMDELFVFVKLSTIIKSEIKFIQKELKKNYKNTKKTIDSLRNSHDEVQLVNQKIEDLTIKAAQNEQSLIVKEKFLKKIIWLNIGKWNSSFFNGKNVNKQFILTFIDKVSINQEILESKKQLMMMKIHEIDFLYNDLDNLRDKIIDAFLSQQLFVSRSSERIFKKNQFLKEIEIIKKEKLKKDTILLKEYEQLIQQKKAEIDKTFAQNYLKLKSNLNNYEKQLESIKKEINANQSNKEKELIQAKHFVKKAHDEQKNQYQKYYQLELKNFQANKNKIELSDAIKNPNLYPLLDWQSKIAKAKAKGKSYIELGNKIKDKTYEGDYKIGVGEAILRWSDNFEKIVNNYFFEKQTYEKSKKFLKWDAKKEADLNLKIANRKKQFHININQFKKQLSKKQISKKAYKNSYLKEEVFLEEDIKVIKLETAKHASEYERKDLGIQLITSYKLANKQRDSEINDIRKKTPIEVSKNSSYWKTFLAILLPGLPDIINKNWPKGILMFLVSILMYAFLLPYAFGVFNIHGRGVIGLVQLSWPVLENPLSGPVYVDSRYSLIEGVIGLLFLILTIIFIVVSAISTWRISRNQEMGIRSNNWSETKQILRNNGFPYAISLPGWILITFIVVVPIIVSILLAFTNIGHFHNPNAGDQTNWVGFQQFINLFSNSDFFVPLGQVFLWNIIWAISSTSVVIFLGTILALTIEAKGVKGKIIWRTIFMLPWAIPAFLSILFYKVIFSDASTGLVNSILLDLNIITQPIRWGADLLPSRIILILIQGWLGHSYIVLLISGYMKSISNDVYEAASIDGAGNQKQFWKLTAPLVLMQIAPLLIGQFTFNFNNFSLIYLFNNGGGALDPSFVYQVGSSDIILSWIFKITFTPQGNAIESNQALASAMVLLMSVIMISVSGISFARTKAFRKGEGND